MDNIKFLNFGSYGIGVKLVKANKKFKSDWKWLVYLTQSWDLSESFVSKLDIGLKALFLEHLPNKLDYNQIYFFVEPIGNQLIQYQPEGTNKNYYYLICSLRYDRECLNYYGFVTWFDSDNYSEIDITNDVSDVNIQFEWKASEENNDSDILDHLPYVKNIKDPIKVLDLNTKFVVISDLDSMPHEGKFAITLFDIVDVEKVYDALETARCKWNTQTDGARATNNPSLEQGYCHTITFDGVEDNLAYWYIDAGSAHEGIHEYLLRQLSDSDIKIKSVEIQTL